MSKQIVGIMDSSIGGVNRYIVDYINKHRDSVCGILITDKIDEMYSKELGNKIRLFKISSILNPFKLYKESAKLFSSEKWDSIYLNISTNLFFPILLAAKNYKIKERIVHSHSSYSSDKKLVKRLIICFLNIVLRKKVVQFSTIRKACSDKAAFWLFGKEDYVFEKNRVKQDKFLFNPIKRDEIRQKFQLCDNYVIGFIGGFNYAKNNEYFVRLAKKNCKNRNLKFFLIGDGVTRKKIEKKIQKYKLSDNFIFLGNVSNPNDYYNAFDCFVLPSRFEGFPIVGIEAQINGLPCFFSNRITTQVKLLKTTKFFSISSMKDLSDEIQKLPPRVKIESINTMLRDFIF